MQFVSEAQGCSWKFYSWRKLVDRLLPPSAVLMVDFLTGVFQLPGKCAKTLNFLSFISCFCFLSALPFLSDASCFVSQTD